MPLYQTKSFAEEPLDSEQENHGTEPPPARPEDGLACGRLFPVNGLEEVRKLRGGLFLAQKSTTGVAGHGLEQRPI